MTLFPTHRRRLSMGAALFVLTAAAAALAAHAQAVAAPVAPSSAGSQPTAQGGANAAAIIDAGDDSLVVGTGELGGVELYRLDGRRVGSVPAGEAYGVDVRRYAVGGRQIRLLGALDRQANRILLFEVDPAAAAAKPLNARELKLSFKGEGLCLFNSRRDGALYAFALGGDGEVDQWRLFATADGKIDGRLVRSLHLSSESSYCVADDRTGALYVSQDALGVWKFDADPETDATPSVVDIVRFGHISGEVGGLALIDGGDGARWLVAANQSDGDFNLYDRSRDDAFVGRFGVAGVKDAAGLAAVRTPLGAAYPQGLLVVANDADDAAGYRYVSFADVAQGMKIATGTPQTATAASGAIPIVMPVMETAPVDHAGDAADDPAIWVNPTDPARSAIVATNKQVGLVVYDLKGAVLQTLPDGKMNNVDLRDGFKLGGKAVTLVAASDRTHKTIALYTLDPATRQLTSVADGPQATGLGDPYGLCMYQSRTGTYVFINDTDGRMKQWRLTPTKAGKVAAREVRAWSYPSQAEGCVADDEAGALYVAQEDVALFRMGAEPKSGLTMTTVQAVKDNPALKDDLEGVGLYAQAGGKGYIVVSSQGNNTYAVFRREGANAYVGSFAVGADAAKGIDGISETDGLEVTSRSLGPDYPQGAFIAQDGRNIDPQENQNFKLVPWTSIAGALKLN